MRTAQRNGFPDVAARGPTVVVGGTIWPVGKEIQPFPSKTKGFSRRHGGTHEGHDGCQRVCIRPQERGRTIPRRAVRLPFR